MRLLAFPLFIGAFYSCQSNKTEKPPDAAPAAVMAALDTSTASSFKNFPLNFDNDKVHYPAAILTTGSFHEDEPGIENCWPACKCWLLTVDLNEISL
ncbi:hypothetical protein A4H97_18595 [Niastella yeongjuensis]|uniref:Uncharacterized protein n=2 Tax=Niastella yeongjuensis TaxID=354355 RepID=A0A1V9DY49_9BACT|nr:hypothetical protein A4H97_18595 [Niastella yeongjuensis]SEO34825.1 hypothetical protein SAMN05660816_02684 [Niastella yeongjuensis]